MKRMVLISVILLSGILGFSQEDAGSSDIIWILNEQLVDMEVIKNIFPEELDSLDITKGRYEGNDGGIIKVYTKAYKTRPDSLWKIPILGTELQRIDGKWYTRQQQLYSGPFVEYYLTGELKRKGKIQDGELEGCVEAYYPNGDLKEQVFWKKGVQNGTFVSYYMNKGFEMAYFAYENHPEWNLLKCLYSDGRVKYTAKKGEDGWVYDKKWTEIRKDLEKSYKLQEKGKLKKAEKFYNKIIHREDSCAEAYAGKAALKMKAGDMDEALKNWNMAISLDPYRMELYRERGFCLIRKYLGKDIALSDPQNIPSMKKLPDDARKAIIEDLQKAYTALKTQDLLLQNVLFSVKRRIEPAGNGPYLR